MTAELIINGEDIRAACGVTMADKFIEELLKPCGLKNFVENADRRNHGKQVFYNEPRLADRDLTLSFNIWGDDETGYLRNYKAFCALLQQGAVSVEVPAVSSDVYRLTYISSATFALTRDRCCSTLAVKFNEPDPSNRLKTSNA